MKRRSFLLTAVKWLAALPVLSLAGAIVPSLLRLFKPDAPPIPLGQRALSVTPGAEQVVGNVKDPILAQDWSIAEFVFQQKSVEYSPRKINITRVPGYIVKLPEPARTTESEKKDGIAVYARICPHLGCIFNFETDKKHITSAYSVPEGRLPDNPVFACPCHFSTYDLAEAGKVIFGPAPRPPRRFFYSVTAEGDVRVTGWEAGGIA